MSALRCSGRFMATACTACSTLLPHWLRISGITVLSMCLFEQRQLGFSGVSTPWFRHHVIQKRIDPAAAGDKRIPAGLASDLDLRATPHLSLDTCLVLQYSNYYHT
jgi:hypothetical protein